MLERRGFLRFLALPAIIPANRLMCVSGKNLAMLSTPKPEPITVQCRVIMDDGRTWEFEYDVQRSLAVPREPPLFVNAKDCPPGWVVRDTMTRSTVVSVTQSASPSRAASIAA